MIEKRNRFSTFAVDAVLAVGIFVLGLIGRVEIADSPVGEMFSREPDGWNWLLIALQSLPLAYRRRWPVGVLTVVTSAFVVDRVLDYPNTFAIGGILLAIHAVGSELPRDRSWKIGVPYIGGVVAFTTLGVLTLESVGWGDVLGTFLFTAAPFFLGREVHERRRMFEELTMRAEQAEQESANIALEAVAEERARIARELHDVVAHQMTVMTLQAEGASRIAGDSDPRVVQALQTIKDSGHSALADMRRMVGLLRDREDSESLAPMPGLGELDGLVEQTVSSGLPTTLAISGDPVDLDEGAALSTYRIVQESLTNVLRHGGPGATAEVNLRYESDRLVVEVLDDGRGAAAPDSGRGHGVVGMTERVAMLGGDFAAGPRQGGGFQVKATIPYQS
jgi:signal transduction histidine kinase